MLESCSTRVFSQVSSCTSLFFDSAGAKGDFEMYVDLTKSFFHYDSSGHFFHCQSQLLVFLQFQEHFVFTNENFFLTIVMSAISSLLFKMFSPETVVKVSFG